MSERNVRRIPNLPPLQLSHKAVGIYARVSTQRSSQFSSMSAQLSALVQQVYHTYQWKLADVYIDFSSGRSAENRAEFQRLLHDCRQKKIDLVLAKSISRFARNVADGLEAIRELKGIGIPVYFDQEEMNSFQSDFELYYSIYAAVSQGEQEDAHDNVAIAIRQRVKDGTSDLYSRACYGYKKDAAGNFVIVPEEAENVKLIYRLYLEGNSIIAISRELERRGIPSPTGKTTWCRRAIDTLLSNEKYRGNSVATAPLMSYDPKSKQRSKYMLSKHHTAIIDDDQFEAVIEEKKRRSNIEYDENGVHRKHTRYTTTIKLDDRIQGK